MRCILCAALTLLAAASLPAESKDKAWDPYPESPKSRAREKLFALGLSVGATAVPVAAAWAISEATDPGEYRGLIATLALGGLLVGPSAGQFYAESPGLGVVGMGIRALGGVFVVLGLAASLSTAFCSLDLSDPGGEGCGEPGDGEAITKAGFVIYGAGTLLSLATIPWAIDRKYPRPIMAWEWTPTFTLASGGELRPGAMARLRF